MKKILIISLLLSTFVFASEHKMNHNMHQNMMSTNLSEAGNDAFGTIQEIIEKLNKDPNTNWNEVNIEALRAHLVDMYEMTINIKVLSSKNIKNGLKTIIIPTTSRAKQSLQRVFQAHPKMLKNETGWNMQITQNKDEFTLLITTNHKNEIAKIRALGYIGLMAYGNHHQPHHWMMATGKNPH